MRDCYEYTRRRPLSLNNLRASRRWRRLAEAFSAAADELFHPVGRQPADQEPGRRAGRGAVQPAARPRRADARDRAAAVMLVEPWLARLDAMRGRSASSAMRRRVNVHNFASLRLLWLPLRIEAFQRQHPDIDIRVSAHDAMSDLDDPRSTRDPGYRSPAQAPGRRGAAVRRDADAGGEPPADGAHPRRRGTGDDASGRSRPAHAGRRGRPPRQRRVPELAPLAGPARRADAAAALLALTSTSPTSRCRRRWPATA